MIAAPRLSIVLACSDAYPTIAATLGYLRAQTGKESIELVLVACSKQALALPENAVEGFQGCKIVEIGAFETIGQANAAGVRAASAPIVAFAEDHCFPEPGWAAALLRAHEGPWAAVGPVIANANPRSAVSWADYLIGYGPWADPTPSSEVDLLPGHNSSYKRDVLLGYGDRLEAMLASESVLHMDLRAHGERLYLSSDARAAHVNFSLTRSWLGVQVHNGRVFGAARAASWSLARRIVYAAASPLIPVVRCWRAAGALLAPGRPRRELPRVLPALALGLSLDGLGQMLGYALGAGRSAARMADYEFRRVDHVRSDERSLFASVRWR